jgi:hypothetical protein
MGAGLELTARRKDGREVPVDISLSSIDTDEGLYISAFVRDISDRREASAAQARLAAIVESSADAIVGKTTDGIVTSWNPAATRLFGWSPTETIGRSISFFIPLERREEEEEILSKASRGQSVETYETRRLTKDGRHVIVALTTSPIWGAGGRTIGVSSIYRDVTALRKAEAKFQGLLEAAPDAIVGVNREGTIQLVNEQTEKLFGYSRSELIGQPVEILVPATVSDIHPAHRTNYFENPSTRPMGAGLELSARKRDGSEFPVDISLSSLETEDGLIVSAAVRDISDRIREAQERERLELTGRQSRMESIGQLAAGVAHDFNNLLAGIMGYAKLVEGEVRALNERLPEESRDAVVLLDVEQIIRASERAAALTHQLLLFGRREIVEPQVIDLNGIVSGMEELLRRTIGEHIDFTTSLADRLPDIFMDPGHVEQILMNVVVNARDAMPSGGMLSIKSALVPLDADFSDRQGIPAGDYATLIVSDTGSGMSPEIAARVFEPYFSTKAHGEGSGLGLATVYGIVNQAGGHITIYSEPHLGTTVKVYLPLSEEKAVSVTKPEEPEIPATLGGTILLVEDEDLVRDPAARFLVQMGFEVMVAADPHQALKLSAEHEGDIDLLLTDVVMPGMSGKELAKTIKESRPHTRVLFMSGYSQDVITSQGVLDPGVHLVEKPFTFENLLRRVESVISGD